MKPPVAFDLIRTTYNAWSEDKAPRLGAALAYYTIFSISPLLIIAVGIAALIFGENAAHGQIFLSLKDMVGVPTAKAIEAILKDTYEAGSGVQATLIGIGTLLVGASAVFIQLQDALNTIWRVAPKPGLGIKEMIRDRLLSFAVVLGIGGILLAFAIISAGLQFLGKFIPENRLPGGGYIWQLANTIASFSLTAVLFAVIYKVLPDIKIRWKDVWVGAGVTAILFVLGKHGLEWYLGRSSITSGYGAAGSLVVILLWVYYSSQILLFGAEFTRIYTDHYQAKIGPSDKAISLSNQGAGSSGKAF